MGPCVDLSVRSTEDRKDVLREQEGTEEKSFSDAERWDHLHLTKTKRDAEQRYGNRDILYA